MSKHSRSQILINSQSGEVRVALLEGGVAQEVHIQRSNESSIVGNIYRAVVTRVMPGLQAAFVDFGSERNGFLHIDDNYGMDPFVRTEIRKVFPEADLVELPTNHPIFHGKYKFKNGLPKIHEHDASPSQAFGIVIDGRLVLLYTFESDIGDGWEDAEVHNDSEQIRLKALQMGANILEYVFTN